MLLYTDERMLDHRPAEGHPERPERLATVLRHLKRIGQLDRFERPTVRPATSEELETVHDPALVTRISQPINRSPERIEADTWMSDGSDLAARLASGAVIDAIQAIAVGHSRRAFCLVRPPGHHARPRSPMGFCLYNSVAVGVENAIRRGTIERTLIVDWDVHHGNGTQEIFYNRAEVGFLSIHRSPFYPGSGSRSETGSGSCLGTTRNVPLAIGVTRADYLGAFRNALEEMADRIRPELIVISAGFDAHLEDPVGSLGLESEDFVAMTKMVKNVANTHSAGKIVSVLEGGYNCAVLAGCTADHIESLSELE